MVRRIEERVMPVVNPESRRLFYDNQTPSEWLEKSVRSEDTLRQALHQAPLRRQDPLPFTWRSYTSGHGFSALQRRQTFKIHGFAA
jgi:hypothetical protein